MICESLMDSFTFVHGNMNYHVSKKYFFKKINNEESHTFGWVTTSSLNYLMKFLPT